MTVAPNEQHNDVAHTSLAGQKIGVLIESDFYEPEIWYYQHRFAEEGAETHFLSRLWGQAAITFQGHEWKVPFECNESFEDKDPREFAAITKSQVGRVINISSLAGSMPNGGAAVYGATKAAVESLTRSYATELGPRGITVNATQRRVSARIRGIRADE